MAKRIGGTSYLSIRWLRFKILRRPGRKLRVLIYARYSTDEQNVNSIEHQVALLKRLLFSLELSADDVEITIKFDEGISGEKVFRPGIDEVRAGIAKKQYDLILVEDSSRLFRNAAACMEFAWEVVNQEIRLICVNDEVDTADEEYWEDRLYEAARHHQRANKYTSKRIKRAHDALWEQGAAIGHLKPGYRRFPQQPPRTGEPAEGPYFDRVDPTWAPVIVEVYERIVAGQTTDEVARWLTEIGFPKSGNSTKPQITRRNVVELVQRVDHHGVQTRGVKHGKKNRKTGEKKNRRSAPEDVQTRAMPHLRIVSDALWYQANQIIDGRNRTKHIPSGDEHSLAGIPRNSRGPLSGVFICNCCDSVMHNTARNEGGFRCAAVRGGDCWNRATSLSKFTIKAIGQALIDQLQTIGGKTDGLIKDVLRLTGDDGNRQIRRAELAKQKTSLETSIRNLNNALELGTELSTTAVRLRERELDLAQTCAAIEQLDVDVTNNAPPTEGEIQERVSNLIKALSVMDRTIRDELVVLVGVIRAVPCQQFQTNKVVLRAKFELRLSALLPVRTRAILASICDGPIHEHFERIEISVDLFEPAIEPKYGLAAFTLADQNNYGPTLVARELGIEKCQAWRAITYGKLLSAAGLADPFIELSEPPPNASRWRDRHPK